MHSNYIDLLVVIIVLISAYFGWFRGFLGSACVFLGSTIGVLVGSNIVPTLVKHYHSQMPAAYIYLASNIVLILVGYGAGIIVHKLINGTVRGGLFGLVDRVIGSLIHATLALSVLWLLAPMLITTLPQPQAIAVQQSLVYQWTQTHAPGWLRAVPERVKNTVKNYYKKETARSTAQSPPTVTHSLTENTSDDVISQAQYAAQTSVVKIVALAAACQQEVSGTGFYISTHYIMTNAHVIAGADHITIQTSTDTSSDNNEIAVEPVYFDPNLDLAVLYNPAQEGIALQFNTTAILSGYSVVVGYPGGGKLAFTHEVLAGVNELTSANIYRTRNVRREVVILQGGVKPGNSGSPILLKDGTVAGMVFGAKRKNDTLAYGLTSNELASYAKRGYSATHVSTHQCLAK